MCPARLCWLAGGRVALACIVPRRPHQPARGSDGPGKAADEFPPSAAELVDMFAVYRLAVVLYAAFLPVYFSYRWCCTIAWAIEGVRVYQAFVCAWEAYGACCVLLLGVLRFRRPWASQQPLPPPVDADDGCEAQPFAGQGPFDVSVLIPCCTEPDDLIFGTVQAALALHHPLASRVRVCPLHWVGEPVVGKFVRGRFA